MNNLPRLFRILATIGRYRLDELLPLSWQRRSLRIALKPFKLRPVDHLSSGERLRQALEDLGPIFIKFGQLLSTRPDIIPADMMQELNRLQDNVTPFPPEEFRRLVETALGQPIDSTFRLYSERPLASASIAQVHAATLLTGEDVVIKAVRPRIRHVIEQDVALMEFIARMLVRYIPEFRRFKPVEVVDEYRQTIFDELDLLREAANASQLKRNFADTGLLYVPEVYWDYCRENVMVMERVYGLQVNDIAGLKSHQVDIKLLAERGVEIFFCQVFEHNFFHADMHPGNVFIDVTRPSDPGYIALDMAIIGTLTRQDQYYLARNMLAMFRRDYRLVAELHVQSGWVPPHTSIGAFEAAIRTVCEPIFEKPIKDIAFGDALIKLFQTARRFDMPVQPQLVLLQKTLVNIEGLGRQLYPDLDLWATAHPYLERWIKRRFHPRTVLRELGRQGPEWMEKFPEMPHLVWNTLEHVNQIASLAPQLRDTHDLYEREQQQRRRFRRRSAIALAAFLLAIAQAMPASWQITWEVILLVGVGLLALVFA